MLEIGNTYSLKAGELCNEWVAFSIRNGCDNPDLDTVEQLEGYLQSQTPSSKTTSGKPAKVGLSRRSGEFTSPGTAGGMVYSQENLSEL